MPKVNVIGWRPLWGVIHGCHEQRFQVDFLLDFV